MDGTIYLSDRLFDRVPEFLARVRGSGGRAVFLTNNSSRGVEDYIEKAPRDGDRDGAGGLCHLRRRRHPSPAAAPPRQAVLRLRHAFVCAPAGAGGVPLAAGRDGAEVLLCGFDTELTFQKLEDACILLGRGVPFVATNPDWVCPTWYGSVPDCGSVCQMLTRATGREPVFVGKPRPDMVRLAMERTGFSEEETVVVGDRLYTDVACGVNAGSTRCLSSPARDVRRHRTI